MIKIYQGSSYMKQHGSGWIPFANFTLVVRLFWIPVYCHTWDMEIAIAKKVFIKFLQVVK